MFEYRCGAVVHGRTKGADANATVEYRAVEGGRLTMLAALQGDLATPSIESVKAALARVVAADEAVAKRLVASAPPPPFASGVAIILLNADHAFVATSGAACCYRQRGGVLAQLEPGTHALHDGDLLLAASHFVLNVGALFVEQSAIAAPLTVDEPENAQLDAALETALRTTSDFVAVSAAAVRGR